FHGSPQGRRRHGPARHPSRLGQSRDAARAARLRVDRCRAARHRAPRGGLREPALIGGPAAIRLTPTAIPAGRAAIKARAVARSGGPATDSAWIPVTCWPNAAFLTRPYHPDKPAGGTLKAALTSRG